jgi:hypothetical protein
MAPGYGQAALAGGYELRTLATLLSGIADIDMQLLDGQVACGGPTWLRAGCRDDLLRGMLAWLATDASLASSSRGNS